MAAINDYDYILFTEILDLIAEVGAIEESTLPLLREQLLWDTQLRALVVDWFNTWEEAEASLSLKIKRIRRRLSNAGA